jgi:threonine efflux protein
MEVFIKLAFVYGSVIMFPGPSIYLVIQRGLLQSNTAGYSAALGVTMGISVQFAMVLTGLSLLSSSSIIFKLLQLACAAYLIFLGFKVLFNKESEDITQKRVMSLNGDLVDGFFVEFFNPLALTCFTTVIMVVIDNHAPYYLKMLYWIEVVILGYIWFMTVAFCAKKFAVLLQHDSAKFRNRLSKIAGVIFLLLGVTTLVRSVTALLS